LWHFDYYTDGVETENPKNGKVRRSETVRENFTLQTSDFSWIGDTLTGTLSISHFLNDRNTGEYIGYETFPGEVSFEFTLTITPHA
jgi:hypothetical protein